MDSRVRQCDGSLPYSLRRGYIVGRRLQLDLSVVCDSAVQDTAVGVALLTHVIFVEYTDYFSLQNKLLRIASKEQHTSISGTDDVLLCLIFGDGGTTNIEEDVFYCGLRR